MERFSAVLWRSLTIAQIDANRPRRKFWLRIIRPCDDVGFINVAIAIIPSLFVAALVGSEAECKLLLSISTKFRLPDVTEFHRAVGRDLDLGDVLLARGVQTQALVSAPSESQLQLSPFRASRVICNDCPHCVRMCFVSYSLEALSMVLF